MYTYRVATHLCTTSVWASAAADGPPFCTVWDQGHSSITGRRCAAPPPICPVLLCWVAGERCWHCAFLQHEA